MTRGFVVQLADVGPVLLPTWAPSFLLPGRDRLKVILCSVQ
ncbi:MAG: hypothetical protein ACYCZ8_00880 [Acidimicrobiales bacterium]